MKLQIGAFLRLRHQQKKFRAIPQLGVTRLLLEAIRSRSSLRPIENGGGF